MQQADRKGRMEDDILTERDINVIEEDTEAIAELTDAIGEFLDEGGQADRLIAYVVRSAKYREKMQNAESVDEIEDIVVEKAIMPIVAAAEQGSGDVLPLVFPVLASYGEETAKQDVLDYLRGGDIRINIETISYERIMEKFTAKCRRGVGDDEIDTYLADVAHYHMQQKRGELPKLGKVKGFFKNLKAHKKCLDKQAKSIMTAEKQVRTKSDAEIWFSRYLLAAPIELAKDGFLTPISHIAFYDDSLLRKECSFYAKQVGIDMEEEDVDLANVKSAMRAFCVSRTGYSHAAHWLAAAGVAEF